MSRSLYNLQLEQAITFQLHRYQLMLAQGGSCCFAIHCWTLQKALKCDFLDCAFLISHFASYCSERLYQNLLRRSANQQDNQNHKVP